MMQKEAAVAEWRAMYSETAHASSWHEAHRWSYGPAVAQGIVSDVEYEILEQEIPGRDELPGRFDVRIRKKKAVSRAPYAGLMFWSSVELVRSLALEWGTVLHG
jgi:hypothetical protein